MARVVRQVAGQRGVQPAQAGQVTPKLQRQVAGLHLQRRGPGIAEVQLQLGCRLQVQLRGRFAQARLGRELHRAGLARRQPAGLQFGQRGHTLQPAEAVVQLQVHLLETQPADVEVQRLSLRGFGGGCQAGGRPQQVIDVAAALRIAPPHRRQAAGLHRIDHQLPPQQRQPLHGQLGLPQAGETLLWLLELRQRHIAQLHLQTGEHRQPHVPQAQLALAVLLHPVDRQTLVAVGIEAGHQPGQCAGQEQKQSQQGEDELAGQGHAARRSRDGQY